MTSIAFSPWPLFSKEESNKVSNVLSSNKVNYWTGQEGRCFEREFAEFSDTHHAIAVANGTLALDLALHALNIGARNGGSSSDEVIVTSRTFLASASSIVFAGATPVFADVDQDSQNITANSVASVLSQHSKAIIAVHLAGWPCDMDSLLALAKQHDLRVIEDCAQAHGARYNNRSVGSFGDIGCWSFCQDKIMSTGGEGGMVTTNNKQLWKKMWAFKDHGKSYDAVYSKEHAPGFRWLHESFGTNWRLTEMQSAIGRIQLKRMPMWTQIRQLYSEMITQACSAYSVIRIPERPENIVHACYKHYVFINPDELASGWSRNKIIAAINAKKVPCLEGSCSEVYLEKAFDNTTFRPEKRLPTAKYLGETSLMFLVHPSLTMEAMEYVITVINDVLDQASMHKSVDHNADLALTSKAAISEQMQALLSLQDETLTHPQQMH